MQRGCLIAFTKIREIVRQRLGEGNVLSGCGKLSAKQRLYVEAVTDSCLARSGPDTGESSVRTCCSMANGEQNHIIQIKQEMLIVYPTFTLWFPPIILYFNLIHLKNV